MSQRAYNELWAEVHLELSHLLAEELPAEPLRPQRDRVVFFQRLAMLYVRYLQIFRKLEKVYDQVVHPQKRRLIRMILDGVVGRVLELKNEMVEKEFSEYHYMDDVLHDLKLTPDALEIPIPRYFLSEQSKEVQERKTMLMDILKTESLHHLTAMVMTQEEAIKFIQVAERARQGQLRAKLNKETRNSIFKDRVKSTDAESAAVCIQKLWRGYIQRKKTKIIREEEMIFLGMTMDPKYKGPCPAEIIAQATEESNRVKQKKYEEDYQKSVKVVTNQLRDMEGEDMRNNMKSQIRQWLPKNEQSKEVQERKTMLMDILKTESLHHLTAMVMTQEEAIKFIQVAERARQGQLRAKLNKETRNSIFKDRVKSTDAESAAVCIQKLWRGYIQRKKTKIIREEEMIFLGMIMDPKYKGPCPAEIIAQATEESNRVKQKKYEEDYQKSVKVVTNQLRDMEGEDMRNNMKSQIRQWFFECRNATGVFPDYPDEEDGGSALIFTDKSPQLVMEEMAAKEDENSNNKSKEKEDKKEKGNKDEEDEEGGLKMLPSAFLVDLEEGNKAYTDFWKSRNESENFSLKHELIKEEMRKVIEADIRVQVDEEMRQELAELKLSVDKDKGGKAKANAKKKKGSKSGKKKKKEKDLTADRTLESLCQELVKQGLLKQASNIKLKDYLGQFNCLGTTLRQNDIEPMPSLSDVRQVLSLFAVLPLGSQAVHEKAPLIKAILLVGPAGVGKKMLVHAVCQETGSSLFDLSPLNTAGKYPGKDGLAMMVHMVFKVARLLQPSIIWIGDAEKMFYKKVPKEEKELDPQRLKKDLPKSLKLIKAEDRVLIIGTTKDPLSADIKLLCKMYSKIILVPRPDYGSRYILWKQLIQNKGGEVTKALDLSSLAMISDGYTPGHMIQAIQTVLTSYRILQQAKKPLTADEFVAPLAKMDPVFQDEEEALKNWYAKTPLGKKRTKAATGKEEENAPVKGKDAKKKGKK